MIAIKMIEALNIFTKYNEKYHIECGDEGILYTMGINKAVVSAEDRARLEKLGFFTDNNFDGFTLYMHAA